jgi:hypothetical protein
MMGRVPFWAKATAGMLLGALCPLYCVFALHTASKSGTLKPPQGELFSTEWREKESWAERAAREREAR